MNSISISIIPPDEASLLSLDSESPTYRSRMNQYLSWVHETNQNMLMADLSAYAQHMENRGLSYNSIMSHMSTIRGAYRRLLSDNSLRDFLYSISDEGMSVSEKKAMVDEIITRVQNNIESSKNIQKKRVVQDTEDSKHVRLTMGQIRSLLQQTVDRPTPLVGLRDCAMISMMVACGLREAELVELDMSDLRQTLGGKLSCRVRDGKGGKTRLIPYGQFSNALIAVDNWTKSVRITSGHVFRSLDRHGNIRDSMTTRGVIKAIQKYPVVIDGVIRSINPHDLRRTYAKLLYNSGMDLASIQQNLGHSDMNTTLNYIGAMDVQKREPDLSIPLPRIKT